MKLLLVDDNLGLLGVLQKLFASHGIEVVGTATNGQEAIEQARILKPEFILMDVAMPVMDGLTATKQIKSELPETRVIIFTASDSPVISQQAESLGASGCIRKTIDLSALLKYLHQLASPLLITSLLSIFH